MDTRKPIRDMLDEDPIIAAIKDDGGLSAVLESQCRIVFVLYGNLCSIGNIVGTLKAAGKIVFVHADLIEGVSSKDIVVDFLHQTTGADGIISAKNNLLKTAKAHGMYTIHRFFLIDSISLYNLSKQVVNSDPDCVEIMPGYGPKGISWVLQELKNHDIDKPLIASGLVCCKEDVTNALSAGASAISTTNTGVWDNI
jgi:glycerol uptake operon antiterminator